VMLYQLSYSRSSKEGEIVGCTLAKSRQTACLNSINS